MPRVSSRKEFCDTFVVRGIGCRVWRWKWVPEGYDSGRRFFVVEAGAVLEDVDDGQRIITEENMAEMRGLKLGPDGEAYAPERPVLICEEITPEDYQAERAARKAKEATP